MSKKQLKEGIIDNFVNKFLDSYKKGVSNHFLNQSKKQNPELHKRMDKINKDLEDLKKFLEKNSK